MAFPQGRTLERDQEKWKPVFWNALSKKDLELANAGLLRA